MWEYSLSSWSPFGVRVSKERFKLRKDIIHKNKNELAQKELHLNFRNSNDNKAEKKVLELLSLSSEEIIRGAVALNLSSPSDIIEGLKVDSSTYVNDCLTKRNNKVSEQLTICVAGKNSIAIRSLKYIFDNFKQHKIVFVANPTDDGFDSWQPSFHKFACSLKIENVKIEDLFELDNLVFISLEFSELIDTAKFKSKKLYNIHFSMLPKYKGMYTSALPILNGEGKSGVTLHKIENGIDTGDIIDQIEFEISFLDTAKDLYLKYLEFSFGLLVANFEKLLGGSFAVLRQKSLGSSYFSKKSINYSDLKINFNKTAFEVYNQFRAFTFRDYQMPKFEEWEIYKTEILEQKSLLKPKSLIVENDSFLVISTIDFDLKLYKDFYSRFWSYCENGNFDLLKEVSSKVENLDLKNKNGWTGLIIATYNGHLNIVKFLLNQKADILVTNYKGTTLLMYALTNYERTRDSAIFRYLIESGADIHGIDEYGKSLKDYLVLKKCEELFFLLYRYK